MDTPRGQGGKGFAESAPLSPDYDHTTLKYNAKGEQVSYLKGETVKIPAHWSSPGSYIYLKANVDVPRGIDLEALFAGGHVGPNGYFDYMGADRSNGATADDKPLTSFLRTNGNLPMPSVFTSGDNATLSQMMQLRAANGYNPRSCFGGYRYLCSYQNWGAELWTSLGTYKEGDLILDTNSNEILEMTYAVKGNYHGGTYGTGDFVSMTELG